MGMQVHFQLSALPANAKVQFVEELPPEEDYPFALELAVIYIPGDGTESFTCSQDRESCWFDVGSCSEASIELIKWLIRNRIIFGCS